MKPDKRLANTKVYVAGKSEEIQKKAFELGYRWSSYGQEISYKDLPFLFFTPNGFILTDSNMENFEYDNRKELTAAEILAMKSECEPQPKFKPFDKVLVRNFDSHKWNVSFFSYHAMVDIFVCINGSIWNQCIPFEGNESLVGTTDKPKGE